MHFQEEYIAFIAEKACTAPYLKEKKLKPRKDAYFKIQFYRVILSKVKIILILLILL